LHSACGAEGIVKPSPDAEWPLLVEQLPSTAEAIYAPSFRGAPPDGRFLRLSIHSLDAGAACSLYRSDFDDPNTQLFIRVTTNRYDVGTFRVVEKMSDSDGMQAEARIIRGRAGLKVGAYPAFEGTLELDELPREAAELRSGARARGRLRVGFVQDPVTESECAFSADKSGAVQMNECRCTKSSGAVDACTPEPVSETCCASQGPAAVFYEVRFDAAPCDALCAYTAPEWGANCRELQ
jgi:hypothetical protein